jgi:hypothetical protein
LIIGLNTSRHQQLLIQGNLSPSISHSKRWQLLEEAENYLIFSRTQDAKVINSVGQVVFINTAEV